MNKTVSINLSGLLFNLEEGAYDKLLVYLEKIRQYFRNSEGRDEIISDIESRIAELFTERLKNKQVILETEIAEVIDILGQPEAYTQDEEAEAFDNSARTGARESDGSDTRRLFRDPDEGMLAGVCTGIGYYFGIDPVWLRIGFLVAFFFGGSGFILYLILWIAMPKAVTRAEKLQMRGQPVNIDTLEKGFKEEMDRINKKAGEFSKTAGKRFRSSGFGPRMGNFIAELAGTFGKAMVNIFGWLGRFIGFILLMAGTISFLAVLGIALGFGDLVMFSGDPMTSDSIFSVFDLVFSEAWQSWLFAIGLALLLLTPILALTLVGVRLIFHNRFSYRWPGALIGGMFIIGLLTCIVCGSFVIRDFRSSGKMIQTINIREFQGDTLDIRSVAGAGISLRRSVNLDGWQMYFNDDEEYMMGKVRLTIEKAEGNLSSLQVITRASGRDKKQAIANATGISYYVKQNNDTLLFNNWFKLKNGSRWRGQEVEYKLKIPQDKLLRFDDEIIWQVNNLYVPLEREGIPALSWIWKPGQDKLDCLNCPDAD